MKDKRHDSTWIMRLAISVVVAAWFLLLLPATIYGPHTLLEATVIPLIPIGWGLFAVLTYRDRKEQIVGWMAFAFALFGAWAMFMGNLKIAFR